MNRSLRIICRVRFLANLKATPQFQIAYLLEETAEPLFCCYYWRLNYCQVQFKTHKYWYLYLFDTFRIVVPFHWFPVDNARFEWCAHTNNRTDKRRKSIILCEKRINTHRLQLWSLTHCFATPSVWLAASSQTQSNQISNRLPASAFVCLSLQCK